MKSKPIDKKITIIEDSDGEWIALYINGKKVYENHSLHWEDIITHLGLTLDYRTTNGDNIKKNYPDKLN